MAVSLTTNLSILAQILSFVAVGGLSINVAPRHEILKELIKVEMGVQVVELGFYSTLLKGMSTGDVATMARTRYYDWVLTTPTMLFTTMNYLYYEKNPGRILTIGTVWEENKNIISSILACNLLMLLVGYLGEIGRIDKNTSLVLGFIFLAMSFGQMYERFVKNSTNDAKNVFNAMLTIWSIYGVAAGLSDDHKNIAYNFLDIFAKNFFGIFLYLKVRALRQ
jgi:bacteriorhodopsin